MSSVRSNQPCLAETRKTLNDSQRQLAIAETRITDLIQNQAKARATFEAKIEEAAFARAELTQEVKALQVRRKPYRQYVCMDFKGVLALYYLTKRENPHVDFIYGYCMLSRTWAIVHIVVALNEQRIAVRV